MNYIISLWTRRKRRNIFFFFSLCSARLCFSRSSAHTPIILHLTGVEVENNTLRFQLAFTNTQIPGHVCITLRPPSPLLLNHVASQTMLMLPPAVPRPVSEVFQEMALHVAPQRIQAEAIFDRSGQQQGQAVHRADGARQEVRQQQNDAGHPFN